MRVALGRSERAIVSLGDEQKKSAMLLEDRKAFCLRRMRGEDRLDADVWKNPGDLRFTHSIAVKSAEAITPEPLLGGETGRGLSQVPHGLRGAFLDHVQELKRNRIRLTELRGKMFLARNWWHAGPWQMFGDAGLPQAIEHLTKATHDELQVVLDAFKADLNVIGLSCV
jgi:hypothetical protein